MQPCSPAMQRRRVTPRLHALLTCESDHQLPLPLDALGIPNLGTHVLTCSHEKVVYLLIHIISWSEARNYNVAPCYILQTESPTGRHLASFCRRLCVVCWAAHHSHCTAAGLAAVSRPVCWQGLPVCWQGLPVCWLSADGGRACWSPSRTTSRITSSKTARGAALRPDWRDCRDRGRPGSDSPLCDGSAAGVRSQAQAQAQTQVSPRPAGRSAHTHTDSPAAMRRRQRRHTDSTDTAAGMRKVVDINLAQNFRENRFSRSEPRPNVGPELNVKIHKQI